ncbi:MAG: hypothetical protein AB1704_26040 [Pseudomonadota bacterium]|uniref:hypothetical protein n=1 Tax=Burkholderiaceae TaxID=119060 RepID=UPI0010F9E8CA|nr:hypothetical protein [Burkholderia sp. 4M9327F10]
MMVVDSQCSKHRITSAIYGRQEMMRASAYGLGDCWDGRRIAENPKLKHNVFVALVSVKVEQFNQERQSRFAFRQGIQCRTQLSDVFWFIRRGT